MKLNIILILVLFLLNFSCTKKNQNIVNNITGLNSVTVESVIVPTTTKQIVDAVKSTTGAISVGGGRYSMGGQTATEGSLHIDMRSFNKILYLDKVNKKITVQAGARWRDLQEVIDPHNLSIQIMQTYSNFTVGGSLSVNVHGRYVGEGPLIRSVDSIKIVLADGREVMATKDKNEDLFFAAIGGYGGIGVITEATLNLTTNHKISRNIQVMSVENYKTYFSENIRDDKNVIFHNANIYHPEYKIVELESWLKSDEPLTVSDRLIPRDQKYYLEPNVISSISSIPKGHELREKMIDPLLRSQKKVVFRNYEASYDVAMLEPTTPRWIYTYALQEYFIPVNSFDEFIPKMRDVFKKHNVNVINVSIRHSLKDSGSYLAWAPEEVFSFVVYYKQMTFGFAQNKVKKWTQEMIDQVLTVGGRYYLPYQIYATKEQFQKAYPLYKEFFEVKRKFDPTNKFRNKLWDKYNN